jgi:hypothetical protein
MAIICIFNPSVWKILSHSLLLNSYASLMVLLVLLAHFSGCAFSSLLQTSLLIRLSEWSLHDYGTPQHLLSFP